ncbi:MAG: bifunctional hydroxymethylpyrimidine kinase/phosphomethylpyrimidine kinase [Acidobacteria bacterium]|nr:bifunctional hydroxymethylpyrimidine kinase/phosphomethylpyrimidine kinase [Acidobacteriota bacterium]
MSLKNCKQPVALTIAGFDPTSGAGITSDLKTFAAFNCYGLSVITSITVQDTSKVYSSNPLSADLVKQQLETLAKDTNIDAIKIGMLDSEEIVFVIIDFLKSYKPRFTVLDPLLYSTSSYPLLNSNAIETVINKLFPLVTLLTPNLTEASILVKEEILDLEQMKIAAKKLYNFSHSAILIKGGHLTQDPIDLLYDGSSYKTFFAPREPYLAHGTGCALSSAITAGLACGNDLIKSVEKAKNFITEALKASRKIGKGRNLLNHFYFLENN